jgi:hypothetical protein
MRVGGHWRAAGERAANAMPMVEALKNRRRCGCDFRRVSHNEGMEYLRSYLSHAGFMPSVALVLIFYALLRGLRNSMWCIAFLSLPGTIAHELAHFVVGMLLLAKPRGGSIWPKAHGDTWRLGSVSFGNIGLVY